MNVHCIPMCAQHRASEMKGVAQDCMELTCWTDDKYVYKYSIIYMLSAVPV